jgi:NAD(P)-dependent dehydrogenase (short-subunit alcohol dehydrogenase family)
MSDNSTDHEMDPPPSLLVTGASRGIGKTTAITLASNGYLVFAGVRNPSDVQILEQTGVKNLFPILLDIKCPESIQNTIDQISKRVQNTGVYGLVNNAGILISAPMETLDLEILREQLEVNVVAQVAVTQALLPLLRQAQGRIVNMSSVSGTVAVPFLGAYCASKFALEAISESMRLELAVWGIKVSLIKPSFINTTIWETAIERNCQAINFKLSPQYSEYYEKTLDQIQNRSLHAVNSAPTADVVATKILQVLRSKSPRPYYSIGMDARLGKLSNTLPSMFKDWLLCNRFGLDVSKRFI